MVLVSALRHPVRLVLGLATLLGPVALLTTPASAVTGTTTPPVSEAVAGYDYGGIWAGSYRLDNGTFPTYCITAGAGYPTGSYSAASTPNQSTNAERIGYIIDKYGSLTGSGIQASVAGLVGKYFDTVNPNEKWDVLSAAQITQANTIWAEAAAYSGPYTVHVTLPATITQGATGTAQAEVTSAAGNPVPDVHLSLFESNAVLSTSSVTTDAAGLVDFTFSIPLSDTSGSYAISAAASLVEGIVTYTPTGGGAPRQAVDGAANPSQVSHDSYGTYTPVRAVSLVKYRTGTSTPVAGATYSLENSSGGVISTVVTSSSPVFLGELVSNTSYEVVETAAPAGYYITSPTTTFTVAAGSGSQLVTAYDSAIPTITLSTAVSAATLSLGSSSTDNITINGNDGETFAVTGRLYGPLSTPASGCGAITSAQWTAAPLYATVSSSSSSVSTTVSKFGCYSWADSVTLSPSGASAQSPAGVASESFAVPSPVVAIKTLPTVGTQVRSSRLPVKAPAVDNVSVTLPAGTLPAGSSATLTGALYGPVTPVAGSCDNLNWAGASSVGFFAPISLTASAKVTTSPIAVNSPGCYSFAETLTLPSGQTVSTQPGSPGETVLASAALVVPTTTPQVVAGGGGPPGPWNKYLLAGLFLLTLAAIGLASSAKRIFSAKTTRRSS